MSFGSFLLLVSVLLVAFVLAFLYGRMLGHEEGYKEGVKEKEELAQFALDERDRVVALHDEALGVAFSHGLVMGAMALRGNENQKLVSGLTTEC